MEASTTIKQMLAGNRIFVPTYQRAYSWDTEFEKSNTPKQVNVFLSDLEDYNKSSTKSFYYFGHFLFEEKPDKIFGVIDGQQRLTTIVIFLSALFKRLSSIRKLTETEQEVFEDIIKRNSTYRFETVHYDKQLFKDYVIDQTKKDRNGLETASAKRIINAFDFFALQLENKDEPYLLKMLNTVQNATCTTHPVKDESEAIQMFIFQNNRGKKPSNLEIIKAQFMFNVHLYGGEEKESLIEELKNRFEKIYKSISSIEYFGKDEREQLEVHSLITLGGIGIAIPFLIKAYKFGLPTNTINQLCSKLESIVLRHRLIGTRADITSRVNDVFQNFTAEKPDIKPIIDRIDWMKKTGSDSWWWAYWNDTEFERSIQAAIPHSTAKYLLWKYENHLEGQGKSGYSPTRFDKIVSPELEHIAPQTPTDGKPVAAGYCEYDEEFRQQYIDCLGNYLLLSKSHNCSVGNNPFADKRATYNHLVQQREIQEMTKEHMTWTKQDIQKRKEKIITFLKDNV